MQVCRGIDDSARGFVCRFFFLILVFDIDCADKVILQVVFIHLLLVSLFFIRIVFNFVLFSLAKREGVINLALLPPPYATKANDDTVNVFLCVCASVA